MPPSISRVTLDHCRRWLDGKQNEIQAQQYYNTAVWLATTCEGTCFLVMGKRAVLTSSVSSMMDQP